MTAETLKPFITTTTTAEHFLAADQNAAKSSSQQQQNNKKRKILSTTLGIIKIVLYITLLGFTFWIFQRVLTLQHEVKRLDIELQGTAKLLESMQNRLGLQYLDDLNEVKEELENALIDDSNLFDDKYASKENKTEKKYADDDEYDDYNGEKYESYDDLTKHYADMDKEKDEESEEEEDVGEEDVSDDANFYDDFEKFQDSKKKRKTREITAREENKSTTTTQFQEESTETENSVRRNHLKNRRHHLSIYGGTAHKSDFVSSRHATMPKYHFLQKKNHARRKVPTLKSGAQSSFAAKSIDTESNELNSVPAAHFQLNRKMSHAHAPLKVESYNGDVYIGHPVWSNEPDYFVLEDGVLRMRVAGLYYIYAQICYNNTHDHNGFVIFHGHKPFLQCLNTVPTNSTFKIHTCHTSGLIRLKANETIHLRDFHTDRNVVLKDGNNRSFFGLIKL